MSDTFLLNLSAWLALVPLVLISWPGGTGRRASHALMVTVALAGSGLLLVFTSFDGWRTDLSTALWGTVFTSLVLYGLSGRLWPETRQLAVLFAPYMLVLGMLAVIWSFSGAASPVIPPASLTTGVVAHIAVSVTTYALVTLAAVASLAEVLQERALKAKHPTFWARRLPSLSDCDRLVIRMLSMGEAVLALGLVSGMAVQYGETGDLFAFNHKTLLSVIAFAVIGGLLVAHFRAGLRGRKAARVVLLGYLLLTLGYPGVKFVTDIILAG